MFVQIHSKQPHGRFQAVIGKVGPHVHVLTSLTVLLAPLDDPDVDVGAHRERAEVSRVDQERASSAERVPHHATRPRLYHVAHDETHLHVHRRRS